MPTEGAARIVSFSGIDGAGKSTQIVRLCRWLSERGLRATLVTFWDDVVVFSKSRELTSHKIFRGDRGIGSPEKPLSRRDKNVDWWPLTGVRFFLYFADAISLCLRVRRARKCDADLVIFDRYIYDELANLPRNRGTGVFRWLVLKLIPAPDIAYVIDAEPAAAWARKPEYPLAFLHRNRNAYLSLAQVAGTIAVIEPGSIDVMQAQVREELLLRLSEPASGAGFATT